MEVDHAANIVIRHRRSRERLTPSVFSFKVIRKDTGQKQRQKQRQKGRCRSTLRRMKRHSRQPTTMC